MVAEYAIDWHVKDMPEDTIKFIESKVLTKFLEDLKKTEEAVPKHELARQAKELLIGYSTKLAPSNPGTWNIIVGTRYASALSYEENAYASIEIYDKAPNKQYPSGRTVLVCTMFKGNDPLEMQKERSGLIEVVVPKGIKEGEVMEVRLEDGRKGLFKVPKGALAGTKFMVDPSKEGSFD
eukprot:c10399_g1_i1.p1 GENE.c10399_g1_i1~~c10399_g1_i1.p1  ORF type:complete len:188 (-),score=51.83 c10399_g1_i1:84-623(-)